MNERETLDSIRAELGPLVVEKAATKKGDSE